MAVPISQRLQRFCDEVLPAVVGVTRSDGTVQMVPVWFEAKDGHFWLNSADTRKWQARLKKSSPVTILLLDPKNMFRWAQVMGRVAERTTEGANEHIDRLSQRYTGNPKYQNHVPGEQRVTFKIEPLRIVGGENREAW
jgi:PPOX class probable F420-dependent enzyme